MSKKTSFGELLNELESIDGQLAKALPAGGDGDGDGGEGGDDDDKKIADAADGDRDGDGTPDGDEGAGEGDDDQEKDKDVEAMAKSLGVKPFEIVGKDGKTQKAYDGLAMLKAMHERLQAITGVTGESDADMLKALTLVGGTVGKMLKKIEKQDSMLKSMQAQINALGSQGSGRKAIVTLLEKSLRGNAADDEGGEKLSTQEILAKAQTAAGKGMLSAIQVAHVERACNSGFEPSPEVMQVLNQV